MIYLNDANLQPLQLVLRSILVQNTPQPGMIADIQSTAEMAKVAEQLKYATIVVSSLPLLVMYPFFQKYFDRISKRLIRKERYGYEEKKSKCITRNCTIYDDAGGSCRMWKRAAARS